MKKQLALTASFALAVAIITAPPSNATGMTTTNDHLGQVFEFSKSSATPQPIAAANAAFNPSEFDELRRRLNAGSSDTSSAVTRGSLASAGFSADPDYYLYYTDTDPLFDCLGLYCEIIAASFSISKDDPSNLYIIMLMDRATDGFIPASSLGYLGFLADTTGNGDPNLGSVSPNEYFLQGDFRDAPILRRSGQSWEMTPADASYYRGSDFWGIVIPWQSAGIDAANFLSSINDDDDNFDACPDGFTPTLQLRRATQPTPTPTPTPTPQPNPEPSPAPEPELDKPASISNLSVTRLKRGLRVTWSQPLAGNGGAVAGYQYKVNNSKWLRTTRTRVDLVPLKMNRNHRISVRAFNEAGVGPKSTLKART